MGNSFQSIGKIRSIIREEYKKLRMMNLHLHELDDAEDEDSQLGSTAPIYPDGRQVP